MKKIHQFKSSQCLKHKYLKEMALVTNYLLFLLTSFSYFI